MDQPRSFQLRPAWQHRHRPPKSKISDCAAGFLVSHFVCLIPCIHIRFSLFPSPSRSLLCFEYRKAHCRTVGLRSIVETETRHGSAAQQIAARRPRDLRLRFALCAVCCSRLSRRYLRCLEMVVKGLLLFVRSCSYFHGAGEYPRVPAPAWPIPPTQTEADVLMWCP